jgi:hypothetical protein
MAVRAADAWSIARFCAIVAEEADDDTMYRALINIRNVWIDIANDSELIAAGSLQRVGSGSLAAEPASTGSRQKQSLEN